MVVVACYCLHHFRTFSLVWFSFVCCRCSVKFSCRGFVRVVGASIVVRYLHQPVPLPSYYTVAIPIREMRWYTEGRKKRGVRGWVQGRGRVGSGAWDAS